MSSGFEALKITITERGMVPRKMRKIYTASSKLAWKSVAEYFHDKMRPKRFTHQHAREAGYQKRKGEEYAFGTKEFWSSYTGTKWKKYKHTNPLQYSGRTKRLVKLASISSTSSGGKAAYPGANTLNFRPKGGTINMAEEFRRKTPKEMFALASHYNRLLHRLMNADQSTETRSI